MKEDDSVMDRLKKTDADDLYDVLIDIGKQGLKEYREEVHSFLNHPHPDLRRAALMVFTLYWKEAQYESIARKFMVEDSDDFNRLSGLIYWAGYYTGTQNETVAKQLREFIFNDTLDRDFRGGAVIRLLYVLGIPFDYSHLSDRLYKANTEPEFINSIPEEIKE